MGIILPISHAKESNFKKSYFARLKENFIKYKAVYYMALPVILYYIIFKYIPMFGVISAFQDYKPALGIFKSKFVGLEHFIDFLTTPTASRTIKNTIIINLLQLIFGFPAPIILALLINEVGNRKFKKVIQTLSYLPHFISLVVVCGILKDFCMSTGVFSYILKMLGGETQNLLANQNMYRTIYVGSGIWQGIGWGSIIYLATLSNADINLYEAAVLDGAGRFQQMLHVTLPAIMPVIIVQLIMQMGSLMSEGPQKTILLYSPLVYAKADIISSYVYRRGLQELDYSFGTAVGLFNSVINLILLTLANQFSKRTTDQSLW